MTPDEIKRLVTDTLSRFETHYREPAKILEHVADDVDWWIAGSGFGSGKKTKAEVLEVFKALPEVSVSGMRLTPRTFIIEGNKAAVEGDSHMKMKDGRVYENQYHWIFEFRDGKFIRWREYLDTGLVRDLIGHA
jgi:ketosteroid isomerase-like protein